MDTEILRVERIEKVGVLTINRPNNLNALNREVITALSNALSELENDANIRAIVLTGSGSKSFVAGADIKEFVNFNAEQGAELSKTGHEILFNKISNLSKPVVAAVNGYALGGGLELALSCHIRYASTNALLGLPELGLGLIPGYGGTQRLVQMVGKGKALEMMLSSSNVTAEEGKQLGLLNKVVEPDELLDACLGIANKIAKNSPLAVQKLLEAVRIGTDQSAGLEKEISLFGECFGTKDFKEGTSAFLEKRKPNF